MGGVVLVFIIIFFIVRQRRGGATISFAPHFWVTLGKSVQLVLLLILFLTNITNGLVANLLVAPVFILFFAPSFVLKRIVVPLGWPRFAYWTARCCGPSKLLEESGAGAAVYGALALARKRSPPPPAIGWLAQKANRARSVRGAGAVAAGLLAALRGDRRRARCLFLVADRLPRKHIPRSVRVIARDWLVVDAARIGNWQEVVRLGKRGWGSLRWSYAVARIAERLAGDPQACDDWLLWLCWMAAPRRRFTLALLRRALAGPHAPEQAAAEPSVAGNLQDALAGLAHVLENRSAHDGRSFARSVSEVEAVLDRSATRAAVQQRLLALGARPDADAAAVLAGFRTRLVDLLAPLIEDAPSYAGGQNRSPILDQAIEQVRTRLFKDIAAQCRDYEDRNRRESSLDPLAEWEAWAVTRDSADRLLALAPESENVLFQSMYVRVCNFAVFQHNACKRTSLAHDIYSWLYWHSQSDPSASQLLLRNMRASAA